MSWLPTETFRLHGSSPLFPSTYNAMITVNTSKVKLIPELIIIPNYHLRTTSARQKGGRTAKGASFFKASLKVPITQSWIWAECVIMIIPWAHIDAGLLSASRPRNARVSKPISTSKGNYYFQPLAIFFLLSFNNLFSCWCIIIAL